MQNSQGSCRIDSCRVAGIDLFWSCLILNTWPYYSEHWDGLGVRGLLVFVSGVRGCRCSFPEHCRRALEQSTESRVFRVPVQDSARTLGPLPQGVHVPGVWNSVKAIISPQKGPLGERPDRGAVCPCPQQLTLIWMIIRFILIRSGLVFLSWNSK